ncbi:RsmB/NOP family class I SAM-dependent RNA methyltransferase [Opitutus sp. GAS368]|uniref:RsmB/NOP family class I SAM-dependent RNA methyltransferase n=1 Tax=Opitutus sp. GAS368 TaxID=1882749 RepID=UPI00087958FC|nr:RsmB/NOP family class I SAM-dependent RNA methyltransferase [Opitutus sp. GAS368]SDS54051.1 16S rRNA (cytosine967-C5)-methyltransferase [Opitutus sp. GAS368]
MNPNIAANQQRLFLEFVAQLRPHVRRDSSLPRRIKELFARHRAIGSRDRKLYRELVYTYLRFFPWIDPLLDLGSDCRVAAGRRTDPGPATSTGPTENLAAKVTAWLAPELKPTSAYRATHAGDWPVVPETLAAKFEILRSQVSGFRSPPTDLLPAWFQEHCPAAFQSPHLDALNSRANVWVRIQANDRNLVLDEFKAQGWTFESPAGFPDALCLPPNAEVAASDAYRRGFVEIQDLGSQLVLAHAPLPLSGRWLDACAGAGGKTLQLARLLGAAGHVDATDIRVEILDELDDRAKRARLDNITIVQKPGDLYDGILVDAPCSGSGTWRRQPHLKWYVKPETITAFTQTQLEILTANAPRVKAGGLLIYATCSLSHHENQDVAAAFLKAHPNFTAEKPVQNHGGTFDGLGTSLLPGTLNTDGFYVAVLRRQ